jgi:WD40 repeat protein
MLKHSLPVFILLMTCTLVAAQQSRLVIPKGHVKNIESLCFSNDGKLLASCSEDGTIKIWDVHTGYLLTDIKVGPTVFNIAFSPDKTKILGTIIGGIKVWDLNGNLLSSLLTDSVNYDEVYFVANGKKILATSSNRTALWDPVTGNELQVLSDSRENVYYRGNPGALSHNGRWFARLSEKDELRIWDVVSGMLLSDGDIEPGESKLVWSANDSLLLTETAGAYLAISEVFTGNTIAKLKAARVAYSYDNFMLSPTGKYCAATYTSEDDSSRLSLWNVNEQEEITDVILAEDYDISLLFDSSETMLFVKGDFSVQAFDAAAGKKLYTINPTGGNHRFRSTVFDMTAKRLATVDDSYDSLHLWNILDGRLVKGLKLESVYDIVFSADGSMFAASINKLYSPAIAVHFSETGLGYNYIQGGTGGVFDLAFSPDNARVITITGSEDVHIRNLFTGRVEKTLYHPSMVYSASFSKLGGLIFTEMDGMVSIWDSAGNYKYAIAVDRGIHSAGLSDDGKKILLAFRDEIWSVDVQNPKRIKKYSYKPALNNQAFFSPDRSYIAVMQRNEKTGSYGGIQTSFLIINVITGKPVPLPFTKEASGMGKEIGIRWVKFSPDSKRVAICDYQKVEVFDLATMRRLYRLRYEKSIRDVFFSSDKKTILVICDGMKDVLVADANTGKMVRKLEGHQADVLFAVMSKDNKQILTGSSDNSMNIWDAGSSYPVCTIHWNGETVTGASFIDSTHFLSRSSGNSLGLWQTNKCSKLADIYALDDDLMYLDDSGYYMTSSEAAHKMYYVTNDLKVILFDQLDVRFNRPDIVLKSIGNPDPELLKSYHNAYLKRLKRLGLDTTSVARTPQIPELQVVNKHEVDFNQKEERLDIRVIASDTVSPLQKFNVWVNDVPLFGLKGISLAGKNISRYDTTITLRLSAGENRIEASVTNGIGFESYREPLFVQYIPAKPVPVKTYFIGIGINEFATPGHNLSWSVKDIRDLAGKLKTRNNDLLIDTLFDKNVTKENILLLRNKIQQLDINDRLIVSYSGHGLLSTDLNYYLSTYDVDFDTPGEKGLSYEDFEGLFSDAAVRQKLVLIDACHSGEVDKEESDRIEAQRKTLDSLGTVVVNKSTVVVKKKLGVTNTFDLMQNLFANVGKGTGATIIAAAGGMQYAQENAAFRNGVFTYCILKALQANGELTVSQLKRIVSSNVDMLTNGLQKPAARSQFNNYDWVVW